MALFCCTLGTAASEAQSPSVKGRTAAKKNNDQEPVPGYKYREIQGFRLFGPERVLDENQRIVAAAQAMQVLETEPACSCAICRRAA